MNKVKRFILTIAMCLFVTCAFAAAPVQVSYINETTGVAIPVSTVHPLPVNVLTMPDISVSPDTRFTFFGKYLEVVQKDTGINDGGGSITVDGSVTLTDPSIDDGGGSLTVDNTNLDTALSVLLAQLKLGMSDVLLTSTITDTTLADTSTIVSFTLPAKCVAYECWLASGNGFYFADSSAGLTSAYMKQPAGAPYNTFGLGSEKIYSGTVWVKEVTNVADVLCVRWFTKP